MDFTAVAAADHNHDGQYQVPLNGTSCAVSEYVSGIDPDTGAFTCGTPPDTNTNAGTLCGPGLLLDGSGICVSMVTDTNTNASTLCTGNT